MSVEVMVSESEWYAARRANKYLTSLILGILSSPIKLLFSTVITLTNMDDLPILLARSVG